MPKKSKVDAVICGAILAECALAVIVAIRNPETAIPALVVITFLLTHILLFLRGE